MVRIAVRTLTLNVFGVDDPDLRKFVTDKSAVPYFSNLTWFIRDQCIVLNQTLDKAIYGNRKIEDNDNNNNNDTNKDKEPSQSNDSNDDNNDTKHERSPSFIAKIQKNKRKNQTKPQQTKQNKTPTNQLQRGVEEQVDHYYYLEVMCISGYVQG